MKKKYSYLQPFGIYMPGVQQFFEKTRGKKDAQENQVCELNEGHTTPIVISKEKKFNSRINKIYLKTVRELDPIVQEANVLAVEFKRCCSNKFNIPEGNSEADLRAGASARSRADANERRITEILTRLAAIKAESDMVDEMLVHYYERAEGILHSRVSRYWRGVLCVTSEKLEHFPMLQEEESNGKKVYETNRKTLVELIESIIKTGGNSNENKEDAEYDSEE